MNTTSRCCLIMGVAMTLVACGADESEDTVTVSAALAIASGPSGVVCGISYTDNSRGLRTLIDDGKCAGVSTVRSGAAPGFVNVSDGDFGLPSNEGFSHQSLASAQG